MNNKYELTEETIIIDGVKLHRIRASRDMPDIHVKKNDLGGFIQSENNLSIEGKSWVYGYAQVYGNARVCDDAMVSGDAQVYGNAWVSGNAQVSGDANITHTSDVITAGPAFSSGRFTTAHKDRKLGVRVNCGCFSGTTDKFLSAIETTHANNPKALKQYRAIHALIMASFGDDE